MQSEVLVDSDAFIGWYLPGDAHAQSAVSLFRKLGKSKTKLVTTNLVINEVATVLSHKSGQELATTFIKTMHKVSFPVHFIDQNLHEKAEELFLAISKKGASMTDCANVAVMQQYAIPRILSFDQAYAKIHRLKMVE